MIPLNSYTCRLSDEQAATLKSSLEARHYRFRTVAYARFAGEKEKTNVVFYESGKLVLQGKGTQEFIEFVLEPEILKEARLGYETVLNPDLLLPRLGVDESGKGDFFGPLCIAGVYVNESVVTAWRDAGIRDSKNISSDRRIKELAERIRGTAGCVTTVVPIGNEAYNRLYQKMRSVNSLLAWGHARVIENLMGQRHRMNPAPLRAISDQFASNKETVAKALMPLGREIERLNTIPGTVPSPAHFPSGCRFHPPFTRLRATVVWPRGPEQNGWISELKMEPTSAATKCGTVLAGSTE